MVEQIAPSTTVQSNLGIVLQALLDFSLDIQRQIEDEIRLYSVEQHEDDEVLLKNIEKEYNNKNKVREYEIELENKDAA